MIRPDQFISVAEETGLIIPIGKWIARQACRMSKQLTAAGLGNLQVAINLSPKQFSDPDLVASIRSEEHTSELQSLMRISYAVFCLKKKNRRGIDTLQINNPTHQRRHITSDDSSYKHTTSLLHRCSITRPA